MAKLRWGFEIDPRAKGCQFTVEDMQCGYDPYDGLISCACGLRLCDFHYFEENNGEHIAHDAASQMHKRTYV